MRRFGTVTTPCGTTVVGPPVLRTDNESTNDWSTPSADFTRMIRNPAAPPSKAPFPVANSRAERPRPVQAAPSPRRTALLT
jgi:hypothetical protein